ncbi:MAG: hypothetical protein M3O31_14885, partial [Acidobacteriota bacterium]|nr:hypothetical protein [Acidobacteriota bacterium]
LDSKCPSTWGWAWGLRAMSCMAGVYQSGRPGVAVPVSGNYSWLVASFASALPSVLADPAN